VSAEICLLAPYEALAEVARTLAGDFAFDVVVANLEEALGHLARLEASGCHVLISRGKTAQLLRAHTHLPVIDIQISAHDALAVMADLVHSDARIAIVGHPDVVRRCESVASQLGLAAEVVPLEGDSEFDYARMEETVRSRLAGWRVDVMIGDTIPLSRFARMAERYRLISSGPESVREALVSAATLMAAIERDRAERDRVCAILDMFQKAVFSLDGEGRVTHANLTAASIFGIGRAEMIGEPIERFDPAFAVARDMLEAGEREVGRVVTTRRGEMVTYFYPMGGESGVRSLVFAFEPVEGLYSIERKVRHQENQRQRFIARHRLDQQISHEPEMTARLALLSRYARTEATILVTGESGTGKEIYAQGIHNASRRAAGPFVAINCGALPPSLLESELFGYVEGAFTGAARRGRKGLFELAHRGTLFLDEIGEIDKSLQTRLLRVIQEREVMRLGAEQPIPIDVRLVAATNQSLEDMIAEGTFRQDLYYRLNVLEFETLPLRRRRADIEPTAREMLRAAARRHGTPARDLAPDLVRVLLDYEWPGNFRQLGNVMERIAIVAGTEVVDLETAAPALKELRRKRRHIAADLDGTMDDVRRRAVRRALAEAEGSRTRAAQRLGVDRSTLTRWLKELGEDEAPPERPSPPATDDLR
jgi:transcriptional regulator with PAS, ATPase and Fis domain